VKIGLSLPVREMKNDLGAIKAFAELAEELDFSHLRIPDQVIRPDSGHLHEPMTLLAWLAGFTSKSSALGSVRVRKSLQPWGRTFIAVALAVMSR